MEPPARTNLPWLFRSDGQMARFAWQRNGNPGYFSRFLIAIVMRFLPVLLHRGKMS